MIDILDNANPQNHMDKSNQALSATGHYKYVFDGENCICYKDDIEQWRANCNGTHYRFGFQLNRQNESITFKNFIIYHL